MIGTLLDGRYKIQRRIGKGGFAEVYRASDQKLGIDVAVKVLSDLGYEGEHKARFLRETASTAKLMQNTHIVTVLDCGEYNARPYLVMEHVEGINLLELVGKSKPEIGEVLRIAQQVCRAMTHAHENGIIHRDLSLNNVMVDVKGNVKVLDFGLAKLVDANVRTDPSIVMGTRHHIAPEQLAGREIDGRADIFAFGVSLYYLVTGRYPFDAEHPASVHYLIQNEEPAPFEEDVPFDVRDIILKCLEKNPEQRFASFGELEEQIVELRQQHQSSDAALSTYPGVRRGIRNRSSKRNPYLNRTMIKNPDDFMGRSREVSRIFSRLDAQFPQSIAVVGERRLGKSSLLNFVYQRRNRRQFMQNYHNAIFVFMDFQRGADMDMAKFIDILFGMFRYEKHQAKALSSERTDLDTLRDVIEELSSQGKRIIVLMDEFEAVTTNPNFDMQFFSFLRFLANNYKVAYVTSSLNDLQQMCHDKEIADSPFFNIFSNLPLRPFSRAEAVELISVPSAREGIPLETHAEKILELSGMFPLFIQIVCSNVFEHLIEHEGGEPDWGTVERSFKDEADPHYKFVWEQMDESRRAILARATEGREIDRKSAHIAEELVRLGYLIDQDGATRIFSRPFGEFVSSQDEPRKKGLFGGWRAPWKG